MKVFIDETGNFTPQSGWSAVCALSLPHRELGRAQRAISFATRSWPRVNGELKGGTLDNEHLTCLVDILYRHDAILHVTTMEVAFEDQATLAEHQRRQCEGITMYLVPTHHPEFRASVWALRAVLERMPQQLYIQYVLMGDLVTTTLEEVAMYFAQRRPRELAEFKWCVDAKDPLKETTQERWWRDTLGPLLESRSRREPLRFGEGPEFDYRYFNKSFQFEKEMWFPDRPREVLKGVDIKAVLANNLEFSTSHSEVLLQAVDIIASFTRRLLNGRGTEATARALGRLQILKRRSDGRLQNLRVMSFTRQGKGSHIEDDTAQLINMMASTGRSMLKPSARRRPASQP